MGLAIPRQIAIEVTNRCQMSCEGCLKNLSKVKLQDMDFDFVKSIVDRNDFDATIIPFMNGEPLLYPHIYELIQYVIGKKQRVYLTSNGLIWNNELFELVTEQNSFYQMIFSIDGLPRSTSLSLCRQGYNDNVLKNIYRFLNLKEHKGNNIDLCLKICQRGQDWEEIENFIYYWLNQGVDYVCVGRMLNQSGLSLRSYPCQYFNDKFLLVRADREIVPCMYDTSVYADNYFQIGKLGDNEDLQDAYNRIALVELRDKQQNGIFEGPCATCNSAYTGYGFRAKYEFNDPLKKDIGTMYGVFDYYNVTFSLTDKMDGIQYED
jgi:organic radical activating enzyme